MQISGNVVSLPFANIDTDQIIPAQYLTGTESTGLGTHLFEGHGALVERLEAVADPKVLVAFENFGCGSSREHAVWALRERGFQAVIAPSFSRIFLENAYNNGLAPVELDRLAVARCMAESNLLVNVDTQEIELPQGEKIAFALDPLRKGFLLGGGYLQFLAARIPAIAEWERCRAPLVEDETCVRRFG